MDIYGFELEEFYYQKFCRANFREEELEQIFGSRIRSGTASCWPIIRCIFTPTPAGARI